MALRQKRILRSLLTTQQEINTLRGKISLMELQNDQTRELEFQTALRGIDISKGG